MEVKEMSLKEKVGQLIIGQLKGYKLDNEFIDFIKKYKFGGYRINQQNVKTKEQVQKLIKSVQELYLNGDLPEAIIGADQEGGTLSVFGNMLTEFPSTMTLGATNDKELAYKQGSVIGSELRELGINMAFSPVADINLQKNNPVIGVRSFGDDPEKVSEFCIEMAKGLNLGGVGNSAKHFPGHGNTIADSHLDLAVNNNSKKELLETEIIPFQKLVEKNVDSIMISHVVYTKIEKSFLPSSMSRDIINDILRNELNYNGVVLSDDLEMQAILKKYTIEDAVKGFILAGGDLALINGSQESQVKAYEAILEAVKKGEIEEQRIDESVERILRLKSKILDYGRNKKELVRNKKDLIEQIGEKAVTLLRNVGNIPLINKKSKILVILPTLINLTEADTSKGKVNNLGNYLKEYNQNIEIKYIELMKDIEIKKIENYDLIIQGTINVVRFPKQIEFLKKTSKEKETLAILLRDPYDFNLIPKNVSVIAAYSSNNKIMKIVSKLLYGELEFRGKIPVKL